jgi:hypothetical protein
MNNPEKMATYSIQDDEIQRTVKMLEVQENA